MAAFGCSARPWPTGVPANGTTWYASFVHEGLPWLMALDGGHGCGHSYHILPSSAGAVFEVESWGKSYE